MDLTDLELSMAGAATVSAVPMESRLNTAPYVTQV